MSGIAIKAEVQLVGIAPLDMIEKLDGRTVNTAMGLSVQYLVQRHLTAYNRSHPNALGGKRTNHYRQLALSTNLQSDISDKSTVVAISDFRAAMTILGGKITAGKNASFKSGKPTAALTIPAHSESYGERAQKFDGKTQLIWFKTPRGNCVGMIVDKLLQRLGAGKVRKEGAIRDGKLNEKGVFKFRRVLYWLMKEVTIKGRPDAIPNDKEIVDGAVAGVRMLVQRIFRDSPKATAVVYGRSI